MLNAKAINAQVQQILAERAARGEPLGLEVQDWSELQNGALFFLPEGNFGMEALQARVDQVRDGQLSALIRNEPIFLACAEGTVLFCRHGDFSTSEFFTEAYNANWLVNDPCNPDHDINAGETDVDGFLCVVIRDLNIPIQDSRMLGRSLVQTSDKFEDPKAAYKQTEVFLL